MKVIKTFVIAFIVNAVSASELIDSGPRRRLASGKCADSGLYQSCCISAGSGDTCFTCAGSCTNGAFFSKVNCPTSCNNEPTFTCNTEITQKTSISFSFLAAAGSSPLFSSYTDIINNNKPLVCKPY